MDVIANVYTAVETWCKAGYGEVGYWMTAVLAYVIGSPESTTTSPKKNSTTTSKKSKSAPTVPAIPTDVPSIVDIKRILPKHCFVPSLGRSLFYVAKDLALVLALYGSMLLVERQPFSILYLVWVPVYCFLQGTLFWAIFVLGHDCGHGSFSTSPMLNDMIGTFLHTIISVPYYPWKLSHKHHHKNTGNMDRDEIFYPVRESDNSQKRGFITGFGLGLGWFMYLVIGFTPRKLSHFNPFERIFVGHVLGCVVSITALGTWFYAVYLYGQVYGYCALTVHYLIPVFIFASWLVVVTFLHHMDTGVAWYSDSNWSNVIGQLSTVDRDYGWAHELTHNIGTHQIHHLFSKVPHYHLEEATKHFRATFPELVRRSSDPIMPAFFRLFHVFQNERRIKNDTEVHVWKGE